MAFTAADRSRGLKKEALTDIIRNGGRPPEAERSKPLWDCSSWTSWPPWPPGR